ncbi:hypothetical protein SB6421_03811 [Klebsiella huaxiensis]|uniref:EpsG family protein n=1 Tax=Klebsiella huaxiensis TaxID=2153354 RepID=UPI00115A7979|nr:EpsG family protein [Klebsiella huaxiensis]VUS83815.1 hypothetical protein SB6421_03811 [Klebsiella huaxiensis]
MPLFFSNSILLLYFLISLTLLSLSVVSIITKSKKLDILTFYLIAVMMTLFYGLRYPGNPDTKMYLQAFHAISNFQNFEWGIGFYYLLKIIKYINDSSHSYIFFSSLFFVFMLVLVGIFFFKNKYYKSLFLISSFYSWSILDLAVNTYRQGVSIPFIILGICLFSQKKYILSFVLIGVSLLLHWGCALIAALYFVSIFLSKRYSLIKTLSIITLILFSISFIINFSLAETLSQSSIVGSLQVLFVGVNLTSKIDAYLGGGVLGAKFYDMPSLQRLYFSGEIFISLFIFVIFFVSRKKIDINSISKNYMMAYSFFVSVSFYGVVLISMTWFIRNFYWAVPIAPVLYMLMLEYYELKDSKKHKYALLGYVIFIIVFSLETFWRSPLIAMAYPS